jgi:hypothetical protein
MRAYFVAIGLAVLFVGLPLLLAGYVRIGCTVTMSGAGTSYSNCGGADALEFIGAALTVIALIFFAASFVPTDRTSSG